MNPMLSLRRRALRRGLTLLVAAIALAAIGCDTDDGDETGTDTIIDGDTSDPNDTTVPDDTSFPDLLPPDIDTGEPDCIDPQPDCCVEGSDVVHDATCTVDGWVCETGSPDACDDPPDSCALYNGEVCCEADGTVTDALCPSPSQPYCPSGVTPTLSCPSGAPLEFIEDDELLDFESFNTDSTTTQVVQFWGFLDPLPDAVDDERTLCLTLELDGDAMHTAALNTPIAVAGETVSEAGPNDMQAGPWTYTVDTMSDGGIVEAAIVEQACFCFHYGPYTQAWSGSVTITDREADTMALDLQLEMQGNYTFDGFSDPRTLTIDGKLTLDACPQGPTSPLGSACTTADVTCRYGYDVPDCGGITVMCDGSTWTEVEHTDPGPGCVNP